MDAKIRKIEINLITLGTCVIIFGVWTLVKLIISYLFINTEGFTDLTSEQALISYIIIWAFVAVSFLLNCYVGLSARALGKGKKRNSFFLVVAGTIVFFRTIIVAAEIAMAIFSDTGFISLITSAFIDSTTIVILIELMVNSIRLKNIGKENSAKEENYEL